LLSILPEKTFHFKDLKIDIISDVYDPAEDTFLLLESIQDADGKKILEIGTGCGLIGLELSRQGGNVICTDINPFAVELTRHNIKKNKLQILGDINVREGDLFSVLKKEEIFDIILFNPPYLPTSKKEKTNTWFDIATDGGIDGLKTTKRFLRDVGNYLSQNGCVYFVFSSLSDSSKLEEILKEEKLKFEIIVSKKFDDESLDIYYLKKYS